MLSPARPPAGVAVAQQNTPATSSGTTQPTVVRTTATSSANNATTTTAATVTVPQGTVLRDASGTALSGTASVQVTNVAPNSDATSALPEDSDEGTVSIGAIDLAATVGNTAVASTSQPTTVEIELGDDVAAAGERLFIRRYNPATGEYEAAGEVTVTEAAGKNQIRKITLSTSQLGLFILRRQVQTTEITITVNRNGNNGPLNIGYLSFGGPMYKQVPAGSGTPVVRFANVPAQRLATGLQRQNGEFVAAGSPQTCTDCVVNMTAPAANQTVTVEIVPSCSANRVFKIGSVPSFTLVARRDGQGRPISLNGTAATINRVGGSQSAQAAVESITIRTDALERNASYVASGSIGSGSGAPKFNETINVPASGPARFEFETSNATYCKDR
jgi:hypothetical protein